MSGMKVARVIFVGTPALSLPVQDQIAKSLTEHDYDDDKEGLNQFLERTLDAWQAQGYFKAGIDLSGVQILEENPETNVAITVKIDAGKQYRLEEIQFAAGASSGPGQPRRGRNEFSPEQLREFFPIKPGDIFDIHKLQIGVEQLRKAFGTKGYLNSVAIPTFNIDETNDRITLIVDLDPGEPFHIGKVQVLGDNPQLAQALIKDPRLTPGTVFDASFFDDLKLSKKFRLEDVVGYVLDQKQGTVDLTITLRDCP